jgi:hypothetical protein
VDSKAVWFDSTKERFKRAKKRVFVAWGSKMESITDGHGIATSLFH